MSTMPRSRPIVALQNNFCNVPTVDRPVDVQTLFYMEYRRRVVLYSQLREKRKINRGLTR
jgi:hypothetical protein